MLSFIGFFVGELSKYLLDINSLMYESLSQQFARELIDEAFKNIRKWQLLAYLLTPLLLFIKTHLIAGILGIGVFLFDKDISHKSLWKITLKAEFIFLIPQIIKLIWFYFFKTNFVLEDIEIFYPLSLLSFFDVKEISLWYLYPLQVINLFEMLYVILLAFQLDKMLDSKGNFGIKIVSSSYLPALLIWVAAIMFFILNQT